MQIHGRCHCGNISFALSWEPDPTEIPAREAWLYKNKKALESVRQGLRDAKAGKVHDLGDFTKYIDK